MKRGYNFGAGPAMLPESILIEAQQELLNWQESGISILEFGHRTAEFYELMQKTEQNLRDILTIPSSYSVLFLGVPARSQFSMIPLNFLNDKQQAGYFITGTWSAMAFQEAKKLKNAYCVASSEASGFTTIPEIKHWQIKKNTSYLYFTSNETINGIRFARELNFPDIPLIADMTSSLLSEPIKLSNYDLIFAGAQKNIANAGLTLVIIKNSFAETIGNKILPTLFDYRVHIAENSLYATPPTFNCYLAAKMFQWIKKQGGIEKLYRINCEKAMTLYNYIDSSSLYYCQVAKEFRSLVNVCFKLRKPELEELFIEQAKAHHLYALKGHRTVGGLRASIYNSMPLEGVLSLINFMSDFAKEHTR